MNGFESRFAGVLAELLDEHLREKTGQLAAGNAQSWEDYRFRVGYIRALDYVIASLSDVEAAMKKD